MEVANAEKTGADISLIESKYAQIREKREKELVNAKLQMTADIAGQISNIMGQESEAGKAFALAQATINTYLGASKAIAQGGIWGSSASSHRDRCRIETSSLNYEGKRRSSQN